MVPKRESFFFKRRCFPSAFLLVGKHTQISKLVHLRFHFLRIFSGRLRIFGFTYGFVCVCACVYVYVRGKERERETEGWRVRVSWVGC